MLALFKRLQIVQRAKSSGEWFEMQWTKKKNEDGFPGIHRLCAQEFRSRCSVTGRASDKATLALVCASMDTGVSFWRPVLSWEPIKYIKVASTSDVQWVHRALTLSLISLIH